MLRRHSISSLDTDHFIREKSFIGIGWLFSDAILKLASHWQALAECCENLFTSAIIALATSPNFQKLEVIVNIKLPGEVGYNNCNPTFFTKFVLLIIGRPQNKHILTAILVS